MERDEKLKTLMRTSSVQFTTTALADESPEAIQVTRPLLFYLQHALPITTNTPSHLLYLI